MPLPFYKALHLIAVLAFTGSLSILLGMKETSKKANMVFGISSLAILVAGFGLLARMQLNMHQSWVAAKVLIWLGLSISVPLVAKRMPTKKGKLFVITFNFGLILGLWCV